MKTRFLSLVAAALLSGCTGNYYHEKRTLPDNTVVETTFARATLGTKGSLESLMLQRGDDSLSLNGHERDETEGLGLAAEGAVKGIIKR
jgi:hypothetical protein